MAYYKGLVASSFFFFPKCIVISITEIYIMDFSDLTGLYSSYTHRLVRGVSNPGYVVYSIMTKTTHFWDLAILWIPDFRASS